MKAAGGRVRFRKRRRFWLFFVLVLAAAPALRPAEPVSASEKVAWFADNAVALRSVNPKDRDYSDLLALERAIGNARVVLLGGTHDEGVVKARYRLVPFLHEEMGFDVLASDLPLFDAAEFDKALDQGRIPRSDLEEILQGSFWYSTYPHWTYQRIDIIEYVRDTHKTDHPLHMAGFGEWVSGYMVTEYCKRLFQFLARVVPRLASNADRKAIQSVVELVGPVRGEYGFMRPRWFPVEPREWQKKLPPAFKSIAKVYDGLGRLPARSPDVSEVIFYRQTLASVASYASRLARRPLSAPLADSTLVLAQTLRPESKIIIWANNWQVGRDLPLPEAPKDASPAPLQTPGNNMARVFGARAYAIAFSEIKSDMDVLEVLQAGSMPKLMPVDGDLESLLHAAGKPYTFIDFRSLSANHWLRAPLASRLVNGTDISVWPDHFDALITIDVPVVKERK